MHAFFASTPVDGITQQIQEDGCLATAAVAVGLVLMVAAARVIARLACRLFGRRPAVGLPAAGVGAAAVGALWGGLVEALICEYTGAGPRDGYPWVVVLAVLYGLAGAWFFLGERALLKEAGDGPKQPPAGRPEDGAPR